MLRWLLLGIALLFLVVVGLAFTSCYHYQGGWRVDGPAELVRVQELVRWQQTPEGAMGLRTVPLAADAPPRLVLVPEAALPGLRGEATYGLPGAEAPAEAIDLRTGASTEIDLDALSSRELEPIHSPLAAARRDGVEVLAAAPGGASAQARFLGIRPRLPRYTVGFPMGGGGWSVSRSYFGRVRVDIHAAEGGDRVARLERTLINRESFPSLGESSCWLAEGGFFVLADEDGGEVLIVGPIGGS